MPIVTSCQQKQMVLDTVGGRLEMTVEAIFRDAQRRVFQNGSERGRDGQPKGLLVGLGDIAGRWFGRTDGLS